MEFRILGPLEVVEDGQALDVGGAKQRALLAMLLLHANEVVSTDRLTEALWEDDPPERAQKALQVYVSQLRKLLGKGRLETKAPGYQLHVDEGELDLVRFRGLLEEGMPKDALDLWRGAPLSDFAYRRFAQAEIARLEELRLAALEDRIDADLAAGHHAALVGELEALVQEQPLRERLRGQLMLALYRSGRQAEALEAYQDTRRTLVDELGIEPGRELRELEKAILLQDPALDVASADGVWHSERTRQPVFVGRQAQVEQLVAALADAIVGRGRVALIAGEPGIGKSRLCDEVIGRARTRGARVLVGRCWEAGGAPAYWPWVQALRTYVRDTDAGALRAQLGDGAAEIAQMLPELRDLFPDLPEPPSGESESARFRLFDATTSFLKAAASARPLVLVLDDLHAADTPSLLLLEFLAGELETSRILVLGAFRDVDPTLQEPLTATLASLGRQAATMRLVLAGLSETEVASYIELSEGVASPDDLVQAIHGETEGNPLFVEEVVRLLAQEGLLEGGRHDVDRLGVPQGVREVIGRRLGHLSEPCRRLLTLATILGREFQLVALEHVSGLRLGELLDSLDEAMSARVVGEVPGSRGRLRFAHSLIRDTIYEELTPARRIGLHRLAGEALEALYAQDPEPHLAELAHHFFAASQAGQAGKAIEYARRAGARAASLHAYEEAARLYEMALTLVDDHLLRCELLLALGDTQARAGEITESRSIFLQASSVARHSGAADQLARAALGFGGRLVWGREAGDTTVEGLLEDALSALGEQDSVLRAKTLTRLAVALRDEPSPERRETLSREAVQIARRVAETETLVYTLAGRCPAIYGPDNLEERLEIADEIILLATEINDRERSTEGHWYRLAAFLELADISSAIEELETLNRIAEELQQPAQLWLVAEVRANLALLQGRFEDAAMLIPQVRRYGERGHPEGLRSFRLQTLMLHREQGCADEEEVESFARESPRPTSRCVLAHTYAELGREERARQELEAVAGSAFERVPRDSEWLFSMSLLADVCSLLKDRRAATLYELLAPYGTRNALSPTEVSHGAVARGLGLLASTMARWDEAERHFDDALEVNARMGARPWVARTQADYAGMLLARGDREPGSALLAQALAAYRDLGMESYAAKAAEVLAQTGAYA